MHPTLTEVANRHRAHNEAVEARHGTPRVRGPVSVSIASLPAVLRETNDLRAARFAEEASTTPTPSGVIARNAFGQEQERMRQEILQACDRFLRHVELRSTAVPLSDEGTMGVMIATATREFLVALGLANGTAPQSGASSRSDALRTMREAVERMGVYPRGRSGSSGRSGR